MVGCQKKYLQMLWKFHQYLDKVNMIRKNQLKKDKVNTSNSVFIL